MNKRHITVDISQQQLVLYQAESRLKQYSISTAKNGVGELIDSECTPRGNHFIAEKIGQNQPINSVFVGREPTGEIYHYDLRMQYPERDWILTRIMWLQGLDEGCNKGGNVDSHERYIYIHGSPDDVSMGQPGSRGCVRMRNHDIIELFDLVETGTHVVIQE